MKKRKRVYISLEECRRRVTIDFEREMGIYDALENNPNEEVLQIIAKARKALEPVIEQQARILYEWYLR